MRLALALAVVAVSWAAALYIHQRHPLHAVTDCAYPAGGGFGSNTCIPETSHAPYHPSWEDPIAVLLAIGGVAVAVGIARRT